MCCLFCDQRPESVNAREQLDKIAALLKINVSQIYKIIVSMKVDNMQLLRRLEQTRFQLRLEQEKQALAESKHKGYVRDASMLPSWYRVPCVPKE